MRDHLPVNRGVNRSISFVSAIAPEEKLRSDGAIFYYVENTFRRHPNKHRTKLE